MQGYYDYGPRVVLSRPIGLIGFMGCGAPHVAHAMSSKLGLPLEDVDRHVEHEAGMSLAALQLKRGERARRELEHVALERAVRARPAGVVVLGDGALLDDRSLAIAQANLRLVHLRRPLTVLHQAIVRELERAPERYPEFVLSGAPQSPEVLSTLLSTRLPTYSIAEITFDAGTMHPQRISDALVEQMALL